MGTNDSDYKKRKLSASQDGRGIKITATTSPGTLLHQATSKLAANEWDAVWLYAVNSSPSAVKLTLQWGGTSSPDDLIEQVIPAQSGVVSLTPGWLIQNGRELRAYAETGGVVVVHGVVHRYE
jgi:hypothetical protein